ncbi:flavodoxin [Hespellia stercorisuis]|uniref:flavodoxin n=1 Tax=Hespellia stercorisuis TaxID=180311 RepID=UPI000A76E31F
MISAPAFLCNHSAEHIANGLNADIYEIVPEDPYTDADLDYNDNNSCTTVEMNDPDAR